MRTLALLTAALVLAAPLAAQAPAKEKPKAKPAAANHDPDHAVKGGGNLPEGWSARADKDAPLTNVKLVPMGKGMHVTMGPAAILWRDADKVEGRFHTLATFTQTKAPAHPEGYGLFMGGKALNGEGQKYTYFLVRGDGTYLIKERNGTETKNVTTGWVTHAAVNKAGEDGKATNKLEIDGKASGDKVTFSVNGQVVHEMDPSAAETNGIVGLRVNHNLDVHVEGFDIHRI